MKHWTEDEFLNWFYAGATAAPHLEACEHCRDRAERMKDTRRQTTVAEVSWEFLAAQRRSIYNRLDAGTGSAMLKRWSVAFASLICIIALSLGVMHPWTVKAPLYTSSDAKLFSDLASIEQSSEPRAIKPIHNLFEE